MSGGSRRPRRADALSARCSATSKRSGKPCRNWAVRGLTVCHQHGGATKAARAKSARAVEEFNRQKALARAVARMGDVADVHPLDALLEAVQTAAAMAAGLRELVGELEPGYSSSGEGVAGPDHLGDGRPHVLVTMLETWNGQLGRLSKLALDAGVDERRVRLAEHDGAELAAVVRAAVGAASVDDAGRRRGMAAAAEAIRERGLKALP